ncbi:Rieske (2Fe-2S) protein [Halomicrobium salinisoli]|uniref:Rieske (2Fe-2S) protein n=1 Tax=Halomicrobium salinisoli TaxID=2878391 RepID=UPI001CF064AC|nr:Rieske 2Fe-2S domain-containing protein [Halomicrobium salinisoli]
MDADSRIVGREEVPEGGTVLFSVTDGDGEQEAVMLDLADGVAAFENYCPHWRDVRLDTGSGATVRNDEIVCEKHGATFETDSGYCNFGPCEGAVLSEIDVEADDGAVYLTDDDYEFVGLGPAEDDDHGPDGDDSGRGNRSGGGRIGFGGV